MSRNNVRGPTSALTEYLRESGITPATVARRVATRQPVAGPSTAQTETPTDDATRVLNGEEGDNNDDEEEEETIVSPRRRRTSGYISDDLDEPEEEPVKPAAKKKKLTKAQEERAKAKERKEAEKKKKKGDDGEGDDIYNAIAKAPWGGNLTGKPPNGSLVPCAKCNREFAVSQYTIAADPGPGWLCIPCSKASGIDPFKKAQAARKRKAPATDRRDVKYYDENRIPTLAKFCVQIVSKYIDDVEALGDIGTINMDNIAKALCKQRSLTAQNAHLFYDITNTNLALYDVTNFTPPGFCALANLNPNITHLRLDFCGRLDNTVLQEWSNAMPALTHLDLLGPFLVRPAGWSTFFESHPNLLAFKITQSPRFDQDCVASLVQNCADLVELRLKEVGKMNDEFLKEIEKLSETLVSLDISYPSASCTEEAVIELLGVVGPRLSLLDLSGHIDLTDGVLIHGILAHTHSLISLSLANVPLLTDNGVAKFFRAMRTGKDIEEEDEEAMEVDHKPRPPLVSIDLSHDHQLATEALIELIEHSKSSLEHLNINGWKDTSPAALESLRYLSQLQTIDLGWCRELTDEIVKQLLDSCSNLKEIKCWACSKLTDVCPRKRGVSLIGNEAQNVS